MMHKSRLKKTYRVCIPIWKIRAYGVIWKSFYMMFYEDDIYPEIQVPLAISAIRPEHLYQQKKSSAPGDSHRLQVVVISIGNASHWK